MRLSVSIRPKATWAVPQKARKQKSVNKSVAPPPQPTPAATSRPFHGGELLKKNTGCKIWHYLFGMYEEEWVEGGVAKE